MHYDASKQATAVQSILALYHDEIKHTVHLTQIASIPCNRT